MSNTLEEKDPGVAKTYSIDWFNELVTEARRDCDFVAAALVRPQRGTGFLYECTTAGRTSGYYPVWPRAAGQTVQWGSAVFTARHPDSVSEPIVQNATWTVPSGITKDSQSESGYFTHITLSGGTDGEDYELTCRMTPTVGNVVEQSIVVPVRSQ